MKKIKKIAASLMALAVTAASMSSIPASAASSATKNITFPYSNKYCPTLVIYTLKKKYYAQTSTADKSIFHRKVHYRIRHTQGWLYGEDSYSYNNTAYGAFSPVPNDINVQVFYSEHYASYNGNQRGVDYTIF